MPKQKEIRKGIAECDTCRHLLHYEWDKNLKKHSLPRCSIDFRDGNKVNHPCEEQLSCR